MADTLIAEYRSYLADNRRRSIHSVRAYVATAERLCEFLTEHLGEPANRTTLAKAGAADLRAFLANRRGDGLTNRSTARELSAVRNFLHFALGDEAAIPALKGPRVQRSLPRPVDPEAVLALAGDAADSASDSWIGARDWAVLLLLYGCGLRVSEATGLTGDVLPLGQTLRVTGKRNKTRIVPLLDGVREAIEGYLELCPYPPAKGEPLFRGRRGGPLSPALIRARYRARASDWGYRKKPRRMRCATALQRICSRAVRICGACRNCWAMPACHQRRSIPRSIPLCFWMSI